MSDELPARYAAAIAMWNTCTSANPAPAWIAEDELAGRAFAAAFAALSYAGFETDITSGALAGSIAIPRP